MLPNFFWRQNFKQLLPKFQEALPTEIYKKRILRSYFSYTFTEN